MERLDLSTQTDTLPAPGLTAAKTVTASNASNFTTLRRRIAKAAAPLAAAVGLIASSLVTHAAVMNVMFINLAGGNQYLAEFAVKNDGTPAAISGFTVYFDETRFTNLSLTANPLTWDSLLIQPDLGLPASGFLDGLILDPLNALLLGQTQSGFDVMFDYIGQGLPGGMAFEIHDDAFTTLFSGVTTTVPTGGQIPEPAAIWLTLIAVGSLAASRVRWGKRKPSLQSGKAVITRMNSFKAISSPMLRSLSDLQLTSSRLIVGCLALISSFCVCATPSIEVGDLISTTRVDRTKFDYKFSVRVRGDSKNYDNATFMASIVAPGSTLLNNAVNIGHIDAGSFYRPADTITVRHDRQFPFDRKRLLFSFAGTVAASSDPAIGPTISYVNFHELGGRPGHEGSFPILTENPVAGSTLTLQAALLGNINVAEYSIRDTSGNLLSTGNLPRAWADLPLFSVSLVIPSVKFTVEIKATGTDGKRNTWLSKLYTPQTFTARLEPASGIFRYGQTIQAKIIGTSTTAFGEYTVSLIRPIDFPGNVGPWTVTVSPGQSFVIPMQIATPATGPNNTFYMFGLAYAPKANPQKVEYSNQQFFAR